MLEALHAELRQGFGPPAQVAVFALRFCVALALGAVIGFERQFAGKDAGLRTHMLVAGGAALFVAAVGAAGMSIGDQSRVIQGVITGIGFLGAGAILKVEGANTVYGLTTAGGIWLTAAIGVAAGLGEHALAVVATLLGLAVLAVLGMAEPSRPPDSPNRRAG